MKINELDVVLLKSNEEATIIEKFDNKSFLIEIYNDGIFSLRDISIDEIKQIILQKTPFLANFTGEKIKKNKKRVFLR